jgi:Bifunctional PLP-dependent enzyme with beta-cystathionase and maltose regulon repressor activities
MGFNFDKITDRKGTNCIKYDFAIERGMPENVLPLWVADMDFPTVPEVIKDLKKAVSNGIFGYSEAKKTNILRHCQNGMKNNFVLEIKA